MHPALNPNRTQLADGSLYFCRELVGAVSELKTRLHEKYERALPGRRSLVRQAVEEAEALAWQTPFPHLFLPDYAELRVAEVLAQPARVFAEAA